MKKWIIVSIFLTLFLGSCKTEIVRDTAYFLRHPAEGVSQADIWFKEKKFVKSFELCEALMNQYKSSSMVNSCITHNLNISSHYYQEWNKVIAEIQKAQTKEEKHKAIDDFIASKPLASYVVMAKDQKNSIIE